MGTVKSPFFRGEKMRYHVGDILTLGRDRSVTVEKDLTLSVENIYIPDAQLVVKNAVVIDGDSAFITDIAVTDGRISALGKIGNNDCRLMDADGLAVTAGDIRTLGNSDAFMLEDMLFSGVSTVVWNSKPDDNELKLMLDHPLNYCFADDTNTNSQSLVCGLSGYVGKVSVGMIADLYLWRPENFHTAPEKIIKFGRCIFDRTLTDRREIIYVLSYDTSRVPARSSSVIFTPHSAAESYFGRLYCSEHTFIALDNVHTH